MNRFDRSLYEYTANVLAKGFKSGWDGDHRQVNLADGFEYDTDDPALLTAFEQNIFRFSAAKTLAQVQEINALFRASETFESFLESVSKKFDVFNKTWLETEYNTAILTGEAAATYHRLLAKSDIFPYWEYRTVQDEHVRPEHQKLHGLILPFDDPRWDQLFPPNGWNCRCFVVPRMASEVNESKISSMRKRADQYFKSKEFKSNEAQGWGVNRGKVSEIFTANQQYVYKQPGKSAKLLNSLAPSDYELPSYSNAKKVATEALPTDDVNPSDFYDALEVNEGKSVLKDYNDRPMALPATDFEFQTQSTEKAAHLEAMSQTLQTPDEVWINGDKGSKDINNFIYIKYYQDQTMIVVGGINKGQASQVNTWFTLTETKEEIAKYRRGILIR